MGELDRVRWHCRRGLLELDIMLERFNGRHLAALAPDALRRYQELLELADNDLFDMIMRRSDAPAPEYDDIVALLRAA